MSFVNTEIQDAVAIVTIDRPKALNALNPEVLADLKAAFEAIDQNTVRLRGSSTGAGDKSFVAGADIGSMSTMTKAEGEAFGKLGQRHLPDDRALPAARHRGGQRFRPGRRQ